MEVRFLKAAQVELDESFDYYKALMLRSIQE